MDKVNINEKFALFDEYWTPKVIAQSNGQLIKIAKGLGKLVWHKHDNEDELFIVFKGQLTLELPEQTVVLNPGEMFLVPKNTEHCPSAEQETHIMIIEPASTAHTGSKQIEQTVAFDDQEWI